MERAGRRAGRQEEEEEMRAAIICAMFTAVARSQEAPPAPEPVFKFGTTVVATTGFRGQIYHIDADSPQLPNFRKLKPKGTIYTPYLYVQPQDFALGFPGITKRFEWFAIDYTGRFWVSKPGRYNFALASDDGSKLYIDGKEIIDNDGQHSLLEKEGGLKLETGVHRVRVSYFQGPRFHIALILRVWAPDDKFFHVFNLEEFKPPPDAPGWSDAEEETTPVKKGKK
jgi:hypothetical protein